MTLLEGGLPVQSSGMHPSFSVIVACQLCAPRILFIVIQVKEAICNSHLCQLTQTSSHKHEDHLSCPELDPSIRSGGSNVEF